MILENDILIALKELYRREGTQKKLAELAGITQSTINAYLSGKAKISNMPVGIFLKLFHDMRIDFFSESTGNADADLRTDMLSHIWRELSAGEQMRCLALVIANFPQGVKEGTK